MVICVSQSITCIIWKWHNGWVSHLKLVKGDKGGGIRCTGETVEVKIQACWKSYSQFKRLYYQLRDLRLLVRHWISIHIYVAINFWGETKIISIMKIINVFIFYQIPLESSNFVFKNSLKCLHYLSYLNLKNTQEFPNCSNFYNILYKSELIRIKNLTLIK